MLLRNQLYPKWLQVIFNFIETEESNAGKCSIVCGAFLEDLPGKEDCWCSGDAGSVLGGYKSLSYFVSSAAFDLNENPT